MKKLRATSEFGKPTQTKKIIRLRALPFLLAFCFPAVVMAAPDGGVVAAGSATIGQTGATTLVTQSSSRAIINWNNFSIGQGETVRFAQPDASAIVLNRVTGSTPSSILGTLQANGNVFLLNPSGIVFGAAAQVNVGGLVASTHSLSDADFMGGHFSFNGISDSTATIVNEGSLTAADGGYIALLAPQVFNRGIIKARLGTVLLAGSDALTLTFGQDGTLTYNVDRGALNALVENHQVIIADGGQVYMTAIAANSLTQSLVRQDGLVEARTIGTRNGTIRLVGDMNSGTVQVSGTLDASGESGAASSHGGHIETSAAHVQITDSAIVTTAGTGAGTTGSWLIDPVDYTIAAAGGDMTPAALATLLATNSITIASTMGATSGNGDIFVNNALSWTSANTLTLQAVRNIEVNAGIANGAGGSLVLRSDVNGSGTGTVIFGPGGSVAMSGGGRTDLYYNPTSFAAPTDFSSQLSGPYAAWMLVNTATDLQNISTNLAGNYALGTNIDASATASWNGNAGFAPLGTFTGKLDGLGKTITGLTISRAGTNGNALVTTNQGTLANFTLASASVTGNGNSSMVAGTNSGTINNVNVSGTLNGTNYSGGLAGANLSGGVISNSSATLSFNTTSYDNGTAVGSNQGTIINVSTAGSLSTNYNSVGGLVGLNQSGGIISDSHTSVAVASSDYYAAGAVAYNDGIISNSYATGSVTIAGGGTGGGFVAYNSVTGQITDSYSTGTVTGSAPLGGFVGTNAGNIQRSWSSSNVSANHAGGFVSSNEATGIIDMAYATGSISGNGFSGGFASDNNGMISNAYATGAVNGNSQNQVGGFAATNAGTLTNVYSSGNVSGSYQLGGLTGVNMGTINKSYSTSNVTGSAGALGGLVGLNQNGATISGSYATGIVSGQESIGGLVGDNLGTVSNAYATGAVTSSTYNAGGLIGNNESSGNVSTSYSTGAVSAGSGFGGAMGNNAGTANTVYWNISTAGISLATGGGSATGMTGLDSTQFLTAANFNGFDFSVYWRSYEGHTAPLLRSFLTALTVTADATGKVYDGTSGTGTLVNPTYSLASATTSGHLLGVSTAYNTSKNAGTYAADLYTDGQQGYDITVVGGAYTIQKAVLTIGATGLDKAYDGTTATTASYIDNRFAGDVLSISGSTAFADKNAGNGKAAQVTGITVTGTDAGNYIWNTTLAATGSITPATLTVTGATAASKTYDGTTTTVANGTLTGIIGSDDVSILNGQFSDKNAGTGKAVSMMLTGGDALNYTLSQPLLLADIYQALLTVSATGISKTYDGSVSAMVSYSDNRVVGDTLSINGHATFADSVVGSGKPVSVTDIAVSGTDARNYRWNSTAATTASITAASETVKPARSTEAAQTFAGTLSAPSYAEKVSVIQDNQSRDQPLISNDSQSENTSELSTRKAHCSASESALRQNAADVNVAKVFKCQL